MGLSCCGPGGSQPLSGELPGEPVRTAAGSCPVVYFWGMLLNFLSDQVFRFADTAIARKYGGKEHLQRLRACIIVRSKEGGDYLNQRRSMVRIYRANSVNCLCTLLVLALDVSGVRTRCDVDLRWAIPLLTLVLAACVWAYARTLRGYFAFIRDAGGIIDGR